MRTPATTQFFPRVFFLYFTLFHVYFFSSPHGFTFLCLGTTVAFLAHAMVFFWNRFELPAVANGFVTEVSPRMGSSGRIRAGIGVDIDSTFFASRRNVFPPSRVSPPPPPPTEEQEQQSRDNSYSYLGSPYGGGRYDGVASDSPSPLDLARGDDDDEFSVGEGVILDGDSNVGGSSAREDATDSPFEPQRREMQTELSVPLLGSLMFAMMAGRSGTPVPPPTPPPAEKNEEGGERRRLVGRSL